MPHPLDGARLKVVRAQQHLDIFNRETDRYFEANPYSVGIKRETDGWKLYPGAKQLPPADLSAIIGDSLGCLRAALDYVFWELASRYAGRPLVPPPGGRDKLFFPIFEVHGKYRDNLKRLSQYKIPQNALDILENVQPYQAGNEPLWWLYLLVNEDKHRLPVLVIASTTGMTVKFRLKNTPIIPQVIDPVTGITRTWTDTDEATSIFIPDSICPPGYSHDDLKMDGQITGFISFGHSAVPRQPADATMENLIKCVADIVQRFDSFF